MGGANCETRNLFRNGEVLTTAHGKINERLGCRFWKNGWRGGGADYASRLQPFACWAYRKPFPARQAESSSSSDPPEGRLRFPCASVCSAGKTAKTFRWASPRRPLGLALGDCHGGLLKGSRSSVLLIVMAMLVWVAIWGGYMRCGFLLMTYLPYLQGWRVNDCTQTNGF